LIVERTENPNWLSNAYLVADPETKTGVLIDGNEDLGPLLEKAEREGIEITHVLVTHPHADHVAGLEEAALFTPGHAAGHLAFLIDGSDVFTADVLFKGTVGGTMAPGASGFDDLKASVMRLMELPPETVVHPGHKEPTTIAEEWASNPFVRIWRGIDATGEEEVTVWGRPATLKLWAPDYDGGNKAWVTFTDSNEEAIVGGSQVEK
jgi:hydroxyacylglutathione hydrolase